MGKKQSASSKRWLDEHNNDHFVKLARQRHLRSRSHFKLEEIQTKTNLLKPGMHVVDLGAAPGSWSVLATQCVGSSGKVVACDLLPIQPYKNLVTIQGDFNTVATQKLITAALPAIDVILSDMAPNTSGIKVADQLAFFNLAEAVLAFSLQHLSPSGSLLIKLFHGTGFDDYLASVKQNFNTTKIIKPQASRNRSTECYLLASSLI